jgi:hypothetical protein
MPVDSIRGNLRFGSISNSFAGDFFGQHGYFEKVPWKSHSCFLSWYKIFKGPFLFCEKTSAIPFFFPT